MKFKKGCLSSLSVLIFLGCLTFGAAHAQDFGNWEGKWFKITQKNNLVLFNGSKMVMGTENILAFFKIKGNSTNTKKQLKGVSYDAVSGGYEPFEVSLDIIAGTDLDFLCWFYRDNDEDGFQGGIFRIQGKLTKGVLKSGTVKSLGMFFWEKGEDSETYYAGGISLTGTLIPESQVPAQIR